MPVADDPIWGDKIVPLNCDTNKRATWFEAGPWIEADIPPRPWIAPGYLIRGQVSLLAGAGGAGKSMLSLGYAVSLVLGKPWGRFQPRHQCRVLVFNAEDDGAEQRLRLSAALRQWDVDPKALGESLIRAGYDEAAPLIDYDPSTGLASPTAAMVEVEEQITKHKPDVVVFDPLVELHTAGENDNQALRAVIAQFRGLAKRHQHASLILLHTRKGSSQAHGDADSIRGAGAIVGAGRVALTCCVMTPDEARDLGLPENAHQHFFRVDGAKSNYAPLRDAEWYERVDYILDNGEQVSGAVPWTPPVQTLTDADYRGLVTAIATAAVPLTPRLSDDSRSFASACRRVGISNREAQRKALSVLVNQYGIVEARFERPFKGGLAVGLRTSDGLPSGVKWEI